MKTKIIYAALAFFTLTACEKEFTCSCVISTQQQFLDEDGSSMEVPMTSSTTTSSTFKAKKKDAEVQCEGSNGDAVQTISMGFSQVKQTISTNCTLK